MEWQARANQTSEAFSRIQMQGATTRPVFTPQLRFVPFCRVPGFWRIGDVQFVSVTDELQRRPLIRNP